MGVDGEGVVGRVDAAPLVVLLAEGQGAVVHPHAVHVGVAPHRGVGQVQVLGPGGNTGDPLMYAFLGRKQ